MFRKLFSAFLFVNSILYGISTTTEGINQDIVGIPNYNPNPILIKTPVLVSPKIKKLSTLYSTKFKVMEQQQNTSSSSTGVMESSSSSTGDVQPPAPESSSTGDVQPPAPESSSTGDVQPPAPESSSTGDVQPPAPESSSTGDVQPPVPESSSTGEVGPEPEPEDQDFIYLNSFKLYNQDSKIRIENEFETFSLTLQSIIIYNSFYDEPVANIVLKYLDYPEHGRMWQTPYVYDIDVEGVNCLSTHYLFTIKYQELNDTAVIAIKIITCDKTVVIGQGAESYLLLEDDLKVEVSVNGFHVPEEQNQTVYLKFNLEHEGNHTIFDGSIANSLRNIKSYLKSDGVFNNEAIVDLYHFYLQLPVNDVEVYSDDENVYIGYSPKEFSYNFISGGVSKLFDYEQTLKPEPVPESSSTGVVPPTQESSSTGEDVSGEFKNDVSLYSIAYTMVGAVIFVM
jgi:hypothetical protein